MSNSIKDALKKLCLKMTGKKSNKESIQDVIDDITKDYDGASTDYVDEKIREAIVSVYTFKGSVDTYNLLPVVGQKVGDTYNVLDTGKNFAWDGEDWDDLGGAVPTETETLIITYLDNTTATLKVYVDKD